MRSALNRICLLPIIAFATLAFVSGVIAHTNPQSSQKPQNDQKKNPAQVETRKPGQSDDTIKFDTDLVTVPVIASDRADVYVPDLTKEEFSIYEDGVKQEIEFFAAVRTPFNVVLMLDTSASTQEKLGQIQRAAKSFVEQLQSADRVKVISFDDGIYDLVEFTNDRAELRRAIDSTRPGQGTKLYDAVRVALGDLARVKGRKAIVIFTDGVDWHSDSTKYEDNIKQLEESSVIVYPIRFDTRYDTEALLLDQQSRGGNTDLGGVFGGPGARVPPGTTPPTVPGGQGNPVPNRPGGIDPTRIPIPPIIIGGGGRYPDDRYPGGGRYPDDRYPDPRYPGSRNPSRRRDDNIRVMLDNLYRTADQYLQDLAVKSGGELHRADTLRSLPDAFANIAAELRNQYSIGYYPANQARDGKYRKIQVKVSRKDVVVRARPGYRAPGNPDGRKFTTSRGQ